MESEPIKIKSNAQIIATHRGKTTLYWILKAQENRPKNMKACFWGLTDWALAGVTTDLQRAHLLLDKKVQTFKY